MEKYSVYVLPDESGNVIAVNSNIFQPDLTGWVKIDEGDGVRYLHAQGNYFPKPILTELGAYRYRLVDGIAQERSEEEVAVMEQEMLARLAAMPSQLDIIEAQITYTAMMTNTLLEVE